MADISQITLPNGNTYDIKDANATDTKVTQTQDDSTYNNFEILLAGSTSTSTVIEGAKKTSGLVFNPSQQAITIGSRKSGSATGTNSFASGYNVEAPQPYAHAEGYGTKASGSKSHAEGDITTASGSCAHAEGGGTTAIGAQSHAEGAGTTASNQCAHAEGSGTTASGLYSHAEGASTTASGNYAHTEGGGTRASGAQSHAEGSGTTASGSSAHAEGSGTEASGECAHAEGGGTTANHQSQHVFGEYNIADPSSAAASDRGNYVEIVGNGTSWSTRSNARTLDWDGNEVLSGKLTVGAAPTNNMDVTTKLYVDTGLASKQDTLTAGTGIEITDQDVINAKVVTLTQAEYDALVQQEEVDLEAVYYISDGVAPNTAVTDVKMNNVSVVTDHVANIPLVSSSTNGVVPQGTAVSTQSQSTKFLREDGTWQVPSYTDDSDKVSKAGDTMTGDLTVDKNSPRFNADNNAVTLSTAENNGVSNTTYCGLSMRDSNNAQIGLLENIAGTDGSISTRITSRNIDTSGNAVSNTIQVISRKNGTMGYSVSDPEAFRNAIGISAVYTPYSNTSSGLTANNVQSAIDEVNEARYQIKIYNTSIPVDNMHGNDYSGVYWMSKPNWSGMPSGSYGYLEVVGNLQKFYPYALSGRADVYIRMFINNTWNAWKRTSSLSDASITRQSGVSSSVPIPDIDRRGNVVIIHFAHQFPAGTYYQLYNVTPKPIRNEHAIVDLGGANRTVIDLFANGTMRFNVSMTLSVTQYVIGQLVYLTDE